MTPPHSFISITAGAYTAGAALGLTLATYGAFVAPRSRVFGPVIYHGTRAGEARVALTFDDGPSLEDTPRVLDALGELGVSAAFFVVGKNALAYPEIVRRIDREGHIVCNHSYDHKILGSFHAWRYWKRQLRDADNAISGVLGKSPVLFRPPMGIRTWPIMQEARARGLCVVTWTRRGLDGVRTKSERIVRRLLAPARAGDILVLHDGSVPGIKRNASATVAAIKPLVEGLRARGLRPARLDELIEIRPYAQDIPGKSEMIQPSLAGSGA